MTVIAFHMNYTKDYNYDTYARHYCYPRPSTDGLPVPNGALLFEG